MLNRFKRAASISIMTTLFSTGILVALTRYSATLTYDDSIQVSGIEPMVKNFGEKRKSKDIIFFNNHDRELAISLSAGCECEYSAGPIQLAPGNQGVYSIPFDLSSIHKDSARPLIFQISTEGEKVKDLSTSFDIVVSYFISIDPSFIAWTGRSTGSGRRVQIVTENVPEVSAIIASSPEWLDVEVDSENLELAVSPRTHSLLKVFEPGPNCPPYIFGDVTIHIESMGKVEVLRLGVAIESVFVNRANDKVSQ